ncbi:hypothetical protein MZO44_15925, partial [Lactiplantibacillus sp. E932]|nr:hypothetical protein [Lactiplantibacillus sp. E932]
LFMVEAKSVEKLMLDNVVVNATITVQRHSLAITLTTNVRVASTARFNDDIVSLIAAGEEADASAVGERVQTTLDDLQLTGGVVVGDDVRHINLAITVFLPEAAIGGAGISISLIHSNVIH